MDVILPSVVFALVFTTVMVALSLRREAAADRESRESRLQPDNEAPISVIGRPRTLMSFAPSWFTGMSLIQGLDEALLQAGLSLQVGEFLLMVAICAAVGLAGGMFITHDRLYSTGAAVAVGLLPLAYVRWRSRRRLAAFNKQLPYALDVIKSSLEAGHSLQRALQVLVEDFEDPLGTEFRTALEQTRIGLSLPKALAEMLRRVPENDLRLLVVAVRIQSTVGTSLAPIVGRLSELVRARQRLADQIRTMSAQLRFGGMVVALLPVIVLSVFAMTEPTYTSFLLHDPTGFFLLKLAVVMDMTAFFIVRWLMRLSF
jgi:tight adherence protein B